MKKEFNKKGLPHEFDISFKKLPVILLGQLGINKIYQGKGVGSVFVRSFIIPYSLGYCIRNSCIGILVYTKTAKEFYEKLGFQLIYEDKNGGANYFYSLYKNVLEVRYRTFLAK
ncbi:GNAT family N-acetyltransferase [Sulfuracidifex tepidarius]|nr:GNAT family N-acetyltransferase [Sulfuracidifex tepidarius]